MCGILGSTATHTDLSELRRATQSLSHRGPDNVGIYHDDAIYLSHLLLAIRGTTNESLQPVWNQTSPWVLAFNGQLYNTKQIYSDLGEHPSDVDTVLLFRLIEKFGWEFIQHIQGMFAIALYNKEERVVRLYRDASGQKGLYYSLNANGFHFASEIKGILSFPHMARKVDLFSLELAQSIGYIPGNKTLVKNVFKIMPSEVATYDLKNKILSQNFFHVDASQYYGSLSPSEVMCNVVSEHLQSKHELAINLSGGLDSSLIFHEAVQSGRSVTAFSTRFDIDQGTYNRDAELAERLAHDYGQDFTHIEVTKQTYLEHFIQSYKTIEEPNFNISVPIYYQTAQTEGIHGKGLRVVLSGDGGDELFGGYPHYAEMLRLRHLKQKFTIHGLNFYKWYRNKRCINYDEPADIFYTLRGFHKNWEGKTHVHRNTISYLRTITNDTMSLYKMKDNDVYRLMLFDRIIWLASENFIRSDKLYMRESMEMRCPLAYQPLRTYMDTHIDSNSYISKDSNKIFLRSLYANKLPDYITKRKDKTGWRAPVAIWYDKKYKELFLDILSESARTNTSINWNAVKREVESKESWPGKITHLYLSIALTIQELKLT